MQLDFVRSRSRLFFIAFVLVLVASRRSCACSFAQSKEIRIPKSRICLLVESGIWHIFAVESRILGFGGGTQPNESGIPLTSGIQNPNSTEESKFHFMKSGIHGVESRFQDCLGFPGMRRYPWVSENATQL